MLNDRGQALQSHAGVDVLLFKGSPGAIDGLIELHEDQIPNLDEPAALTVWPARRIMEWLAGRQIVVELRTRTTGPAVAGGSPPVVACAESAYAFSRHTRLLPKGCGNVIIQIYSRPQAFRVKANLLRAEFPCQLNGARLEVIAKGEVAQHLKESEVSRIAHLIDVSRAERLLD